MFKYNLRDAKQTITGAFVAALFFVVIRSGNPLSFDISIGIIITLAVIWLSNPKPLMTKLDILAIDVIITYITVATLNVLFNLTTLEVATFGLSEGIFPIFDAFGSSIAVSFWIALPVAVIYNKHNIDNFLSRIFVKKR